MPYPRFQSVPPYHFKALIPRQSGLLQKVDHPFSTSTITPNSSSFEAREHYFSNHVYRPYHKVNLPALPHTNEIDPSYSMADFMQKIFSSEDRIVLYCWATWCGPCKAVAPTVEKLSESFPQVKFYKVDIEEQADVARELNVDTTPTFAFFKDGRKFSQVIGGDMKAVEKNLNDLVTWFPSV